MRRALVRACRENERPAGELVELTGLAAASVSEHLKVLRKAGLLVVEPWGRWRLYRTDLGVVREAVDALAALSGP